MADWQSLYPFPSQFYAPHGSTGPRLHYVQAGPDSDLQLGQQTVLCVHGNPTWSFYYREILNHQRSSARAIAVDNMGCGLSDKPQHYDYCLKQHIANLVGLIKELDLRNITLVVHDWGGAIGLGAAEQVPERMSGLVVLNTAAFPPPYIPIRIAACRWPLVGNWAMRRLNLFARAALTMTLNRLPRLDDAVAAGLIAPYDSWNHRVAIARFVQDIPMTKDHPTWQVLYDIETHLKTLAHLPIEIVWGMRDWCFRPECLERFETIWPDAHVTRLDDVGHYVMEEASREVNEAVARCRERQS